MKWLPSFCPLTLVVVLTACAAAPEIAYESAADPTNQVAAMDSGEARALEQAESDCARQGLHAVSQRVEGETTYDCVDSD